MTRYILIFATIVLGLFALQLTPWGQARVVIPFTSGVAALSAGLIQLWDAQVAAQGKVIWNTVKNGYGIAFYSALLLATPAEDFSKLLRWLLGVALLTLAQCAGIAAEASKILAFQLGPDATAQLAFPGWALDALALGYQIGYLILPPALPALIWLWQARHVLAQMTGWQAPGEVAQH